MSGIVDYLAGKKIIITVGHYGAGKTNLAVNLAINLGYTLVDLDVVNPYFRSADNIGELQKHGIDFIIPEYANTNLDLPAVPAEINSIFAAENRRAVIDVGGDGNGATVLGVFADKIKRENCEMIYVINKYRPLTSCAETAAGLAREIERKSKLKITSVINNSNIGRLTTEKEILDSMEYAKKTAGLLAAPLIGTSLTEDIDFSEKKEYNIFTIKNHTKKLF